MYGSSIDKSTMNKPTMNKPVMIKRKYPHDMFKVDVDMKVARNEAEHMKLEKAGYTHNKPKMSTHGKPKK